MVKDLVDLASILEKPNLEEETIRDINLTIRELLVIYRNASQNAYKPLEEQAKALLGTDVFAEWLNGPQAAKKEG